MTTSPVLTSPPSSVVRNADTLGKHSPGEFMVGQMLNIKVQQRLDEQHYLAVLRGESRKVFSERQLPVGETIDVVVVRVADKLELRQVAADSLRAHGSQESITNSRPTDYADMRSVAKFYKCDFTAAELATLQAAVNQAPDAEKMALAGLLLNKRGLGVQPGLLNALYAVQSRPTQLLGSVADITTNNEFESGEPTVAALAQLMRQVLQDRNAAIQTDLGEEQIVGIDATTDSVLPHAPDMAGLSQTTSQNSGGNEQPPHRFFQLLNDIDADGMGVRYGTLPVLIDGQLVELELVMFQHRPRDAVAEPLRRLVMSVHTSTLGTVQITAEALSNRLMINISGESVEHAEALAAYADEVKELVTNFGWSLDSVGYEVRTQGGRLAQRVIEHGVRQGVIDNVW